MSALMQAEVINLSRDIVITGDDFEHVNCVKDVARTANHPIIFKPIIVHVGIILTEINARLDYIQLQLDPVLFFLYNTQELRNVVNVVF